MDIKGWWKGNNSYQVYMGIIFGIVLAILCLSVYKLDKLENQSQAIMKSQALNLIAQDEEARAFLNNDYEVPYDEVIVTYSYDQGKKIYQSFEFSLMSGHTFYTVYVNIDKNNEIYGMTIDDFRANEKYVMHFK